MFGCELKYFGKLPYASNIFPFLIITCCLSSFFKLWMTQVFIRDHNLNVRLFNILVSCDLNVSLFNFLVSWWKQILSPLALLQSCSTLCLLLNFSRVPRVLPFFLLCWNVLPSTLWIIQIPSISHLLPLLLRFIIDTWVLEFNILFSIWNLSERWRFVKYNELFLFALGLTRVNFLNLTTWELLTWELLIFCKFQRFFLLLLFFIRMDWNGIRSGKLWAYKIEHLSWVGYYIFSFNHILVSGVIVNVM